jgi:hypothetical protein
MAMGLVTISTDMKEMYASFHRLKRLNRAGFLTSIDSGAGTPIRMVFPIQPTIGLHTPLGLQTPSLRMKASGMTPMMMAMETTSSILTDKRFVTPTVAMVVEPQKGPRLSTVGAVPTVTKTDGLTQQTHGLPVRVAGATLGQWTPHNGMISMVMAVETIRVGPPQMCVQTKQEPPSDLLLEVTDGAVLTPMVMAGRTSVMPSFTNQPNGEIPMAMDTVTTMMEIKAMLALKLGAPQCLID